MSAPTKTHPEVARQAREAVQAASKAADDPIEVPEPEHRRFRRVGFSHMPLKWDGSPVNNGGVDKGSEAMMIARIHHAVRQAVDDTFADAFELLYELYALVREQKIIDGEPVFDEHELPVWKTTPAGNPIEDWSNLGISETKNYLYKITIRLFDWEQRANEAWAEAMFAKAVWEDAYSIGFELLPGTRVTIPEREARAKLESRDQRYFAIFKTYYSRQAEALVRTFQLLNQRLKDTLG